MKISIPEAFKGIATTKINMILAQGDVKSIEFGDDIAKIKYSGGKVSFVDVYGRVIWES